jgi:serine protease AprX
MSLIRRSYILARLTTLSLVVSVFAGLLIPGGTVRAQNPIANGRRVVARDLANLPYTIRVEMKVLVQLSVPETPAFTAFLSRPDVKVQFKYTNFPIYALKVNSDSLAALVLMNEVDYVSLRKPLKKFGHISLTTGADAATGQLVSGTKLDGSGIGIAVLDSGIDTSQPSFTNNNRNNVILSRDFTDEGRTDDPYGHGTHVASLIVGSRAIGGGRYNGIATGANLLNLRVLNSQGTGDVMDLLRAIDWVITNRATYNIRIVNMSLGMTAVDSYRYDPVCRAVRKLVDSGILAIAAAGNNGKDAAGGKIYGYIHTPGIEPSALTVGASNTFLTNARRDDGVTTYSSRGPTRGSWVDATGLIHYDNLIKPDMVAPGNKIIGAEASNNWIITHYPQLNINTAEAKMMRLSGTSMAAPLVAGAAALILQANPRLTPNLVKIILMYTAQPLAGFNMFEQGAGQLNISGAVQMARAMRTTLYASTPLGAPLLMNATPPTPSTTIAAYSFTWAQGIVLNHTFATGSDLLTKYQKVYGKGSLLGDGVVEGFDTQAVDPRKMTGGVVLGTSILTSNGNSMGSGSFFLSTGQMLGDGLMLGDGMVLGDGMMLGDGMVLGDNGTTSDGIMLGD